MMNFPLFAQAATDATGAAGPGSLLGGPIPMVALMFIMMYFVLIRPQRQRQKQQEAMQSAIKAGDHVVTIGGVHGIIASVKDKTIMVKVADNVRIEFDKSAIASTTKKSAETES